MNNIFFNKIETNNLKKINYSIVENACNCVVGPSGSGKSSLVFDTINAISQHEYNTMIGEVDDFASYKLDSYNRILITVPIKQLNFNNNPRSTIATYYNIDQYFKNLFSLRFEKENNFFSFNKYTSTCKTCNGLGYELIPDESAIIDYDSSIINIPFIPWRGTYKDFYKQLLLQVSLDEGISTNVPFRELDAENKKFLLYGKSEKKYKIIYNQGNRKRVKTTKYIGLIPLLTGQIKNSDNEAIKFSQYIVCSRCGGTRFSNEVNRLKINNNSIGEIYLLTISELKEWTSNLINDNTDVEIDRILKNVLSFANKLIDVKLDYLNLNRSIESLSGGEFQRLRLSQILNSKLNNILFILDEPLSSLHISEKRAVTDEIMKLKDNNTLLVIEHDNDFITRCDYITAIGPLGGNYGGDIIPLNPYILSSNKKESLDTKISESFIDIKSNYIVNNVKPFEIKIPLYNCIGVCGVSGSGKSTFAKEILPKLLPNYRYISQKPIRGNAYSIVATYIDVIDKIRQLFSESNKVSKSFFSFYHSSAGACKKCNGKGKMTIEDYKNKYIYLCPDCEGKKYSTESLKYRYDGLNIYEVLSLEISEAAQFFKNDKELFELLNIANKIGLGYLKLNQPIESLSGGENQRVKLVKHINFNTKNKTIALDEPFQGLNNSEIYKIMNVLYQYCNNENTVMIIEHNIYALELCSYLIEFGAGSGENGGKIIYSGIKKDILKSNESIIKDYIE